MLRRGLAAWRVSGVLEWSSLFSFGASHNLHRILTPDVQDVNTMLPKTSIPSIARILAFIENRADLLEKHCPRKPRSLIELLAQVQAQVGELCSRRVAQALRQTFLVRGPQLRGSQSTFPIP